MRLRFAAQWKLGHPSAIATYLGMLMWTPATRRQYSRAGLRYETDVTDAEWALIEPLLPPPPKRGRPRFWPMREIMNAIFYVLRGGADQRPGRRKVWMLWV